MINRSYLSTLSKYLLYGLSIALLIAAIYTLSGCEDGLISNNQMIVPSEYRNFGLSIGTSANILVSGNVYRNLPRGINLNGGNDIHLQGNTIMNVSGHAISLDSTNNMSSTNDTIDLRTTNNDQHGIRLLRATDTTIHNLTCSGAKEAIFIGYSNHTIL